MEKHITAGVFAFIFAVLAGAGCSMIFALPFISGEHAPAIFYFYLIAGAVSIPLAISGGVYAIRHSSKSFVLCWAALQFVFPIGAGIAFSGLLDTKNVLSVSIGITIFLPDLLGCLALLLTAKPKHTLAYVSELINLCVAMAFLMYSIFKLGSVGFSVGFGMLGFLGCGFIIAALIRAHFGRALSFELSILSLLCFAAQFIVILTICGICVSALLLMLGIFSVIMTIIGGILIADSLESGFIIASLGIILFLILLIFAAFKIGIAYSLLSLIAVVGVVIHFAETVKMRFSENAKITKSV